MIVWSAMLRGLTLILRIKSDAGCHSWTGTFQILTTKDTKSIH